MSAHGNVYSSMNSPKLSAVNSGYSQTSSNDSMAGGGASGLHSSNQ